MNNVSRYAAMGAALHMQGKNNLPDDKLKEIGKILQRKRIALQLAINDIAASLMISQHHIKALEEGDWNSLPAEVYAKGYLRKYALYLDLDSEMIMAKLPIKTPEQKLIQKPILKKKTYNNYLKLSSVSILLFVAAIALIMLYPNKQTRIAHLVKPVSQQYVSYATLSNNFDIPNIPNCFYSKQTIASWQCYSSARFSNNANSYLIDSVIFSD